jgi:glycosyltransferase involved in cell wall biosynthesis
MPAISVLVPVYNVEEYIYRGIESIMQQSFSDFEVILVDDGSEDNSPMVCDSYAEKDSRIKVFHKQHQGVGATRECLLSYAKGKYLQFVDVDDWIEPEMLQEMYSCAETTKADIVSCCFDEVFPEKTNTHNLVYEDRDAFINDVIGNNWGVLWKHLILRDLVVANDIHFPVGLDGGEDYQFMVKALACASRIACVNKVLYHYNRCNANSIMSSSSLTKVLNQINATVFVDSFLKKKHLDVKFKSALDKRKFIVKRPLLSIDMWQWYGFFPESNYLMWHEKMGFRTRLKCIFLILCGKIYRN